MKIKAHTDQDPMNPSPMTTRTRMLFAEPLTTTRTRGVGTLLASISTIRVHGTGAQGTMTRSSLADIRTTWDIRTVTMDMAIPTTDTATAGTFLTTASSDIPG